MSTVNLIYAASLDGVIGHRGHIPWYLPPDLKRFKALTAGGTVVMGRKTWESLPIKPLPGRENIVLSHDMNYQAPGAVVVPDLKTALAQASREQVWIIGGESVYREALPYAEYAYVTTVELRVVGDTYAPNCQGYIVDFTGDVYTDENGRSIHYQFAQIKLYKNHVRPAQDRAPPPAQSR